MSCHPTDRAGRRPPRQAGADQRLRQDRARRPRPRPGRGRRGDRVHRHDGRVHRGPRAAGDPGRVGDRFPGDASTAGSRRCTRRSTPACWPTCAWTRTSPSSPNSTSSRSTCWSATSTRSPRRSPPAPTSTAASSRSTSAARRWCGRPRRTTPASRVVTSPEAYPHDHQGGGERRPHARAASCAGRARVRGHRRATTSRSPSGSSVQEALADGGWWPEFGGMALTLETTLRYGENPHQKAALYVDPTRPAGLAQAAQPAGQGDVLQQLHRRGRRLAQRQRLHRAVRRDHQAPEPVRHRGRRRRRRGAPQGARVRPGLGLRRRDRGEPAGHRSRWRRSSRTSSPR